MIFKTEFNTFNGNRHARVDGESMESSILGKELQPDKEFWEWEKDNPGKGTSTGYPTLMVSSENIFTSNITQTE